MPKGPGVGSYTSAGNISLQAYGDAIRALTKTSAASNGACALVSQSLSASAAWSVTLCATWMGQPGGTFPEIGCVITNGNTVGTSVAHGLTIFVNGTTSGQGFGTFWQAGFTVGGARTGAQDNLTDVYAPYMFGTGRLHMRLLNDGVNLHSQLSSDGFNWQDWYTIATPFSPTFYGFYLGNTEASSTGSYVQAVVYENLLNQSITQATVTACTGSGVAVEVTVANTGAFQAGDLVAVHGMAGNTAANTSTGAGPGGSILVTAINSTTQMTLNATGNGTWTSGGTITLLSR
jgi:hypothetical protein